MAWISVYQQLRDHRKLREFFRIMNISRQEALGILVLIWMWAIDNADRTGLILSATIDDIAEAAFWKGDSKKLYSALVDSHWIDETDGDMYFHDWDEFNKPFFDYIDRKERDKMRKKQDGSTEIPRKFHGNSTEKSNKSSGISTDVPQEFHESPSPSPSPSPKQIKKDYIFHPPTLDEVKIYCLERKKGVNPEKWFDFYSAKNWMIGKNKMKDWKAAVRTWEHEKESSNLFNTKPPQQGNFDQRPPPDEIIYKV
jgi:hypothetical protein